MTKYEIIEMAKQAGCFEKHQVFYFTSPDLEAFAKLVAQHEREACAKLADENAAYWAGYKIANAIRAKGQA